jgi:hypothetical protein
MRDQCVLSAGLLQRGRAETEEEHSVLIDCDAKPSAGKSAALAVALSAHGSDK